MPNSVQRVLWFIVRICDCVLGLKSSEKNISEIKPKIWKEWKLVLSENSVSAPSKLLLNIPEVCIPCHDTETPTAFKPFIHLVSWHTNTRKKHFILYRCIIYCDLFNFTFLSDFALWTKKVKRKGQRGGQVYPPSCPFGHYPRFMIIGETGGGDWPVTSFGIWLYDGSQLKHQIFTILNSLKEWTRATAWWAN